MFEDIITRLQQINRLTYGLVGSVSFQYMNLSTVPYLLITKLHPLVFSTTDCASISRPENKIPLYGLISVSILRKVLLFRPLSHIPHSCIYLRGNCENNTNEGLSHVRFPSRTPPPQVREHLDHAHSDQPPSVGSFKVAMGRTESGPAVGWVVLLVMPGS